MMMLTLLQDDVYKPQLSVQLKMLTNLQEQQLLKLSQIVDKKTAISRLKDKCKTTQVELGRELNRAQAIHNLFHSQQYQQLLNSTIQSFREFQALKKQYQQLPQESGWSGIQKLKLANQNTQSQILQLEFAIEREKERQLAIDSNFQLCERVIDDLLHKKQRVESDIVQLKEKLAYSHCLGGSIIDELSVEGELGEQELALLRQQDYQRLQYKYSSQIKSNSMLHSNLLLELADKCNLLHQLQHEHDSAQRIFSSFSKCETDHDLIAEEQSLIDQIAQTSQQIERETLKEKQLTADCEQNVRSEAVAQAHTWMGHRLNEIQKKKNTIRALLEIVVTSEHSQAEIGEIESQLRALEEEQGRVREKLQC